MATDTKTQPLSISQSEQEHITLQKLFLEMEYLKHQIQIHNTEKAQLEARLEEVSILFEAQKLKVGRV